MIVERCLSPPHLNPEELIYVGEEIRLTDIPEKLNLEPEKARNYFYTVSKLEARKNKLFVSQGVFDYEELQNGWKRDGGAFGLNRSIPLSLEAKVIKKFKNLLEE